MNGFMKFLLALAYRVVFLVATIFLFYQSIPDLMNIGPSLRLILFVCGGVIEAFFITGIVLVFFLPPHPAYMSMNGLDLYKEDGFFKSESLILSGTISMTFQAFFLGIVIIPMLLMAFFSFFVFLLKSWMRLRESIPFLIALGVITGASVWFITGAKVNIPCFAYSSFALALFVTSPFFFNEKMKKVDSCFLFHLVGRLFKSRNTAPAM